LLPSLRRLACWSFFTGMTPRAWGIRPDCGMMSAMVALWRRFGRNTDPEKELRALAEAGDPSAMRRLSALLGDRGDAECVHWIRRAAEGGDVAAMVDFAGHLMQQREDAVAAEPWYRRAAEAGDAAGMVGLGALIWEEHGDLAGAVEWMRRAAETGLRPAIFNLGVLFEQAGDDAEAERWWLRAAEVEVGLAMEKLAELLRRRGDEAGARAWEIRAKEAPPAGPGSVVH
jgi:TPR repeat protein